MSSLTISQNVPGSLALTPSSAGSLELSSTWRGTWATATDYVVNDAVYDNGSTYVCYRAHTSASATRPGTGASWTTYWYLLAQGALTLPTSLAATIASGSGAGAISVGTTVFQLTGQGDLIIGPNTYGDTSSATFDPNTCVSDLAYFQSSRKILTRSAVFREVGDAAEIQIGRAGGTYPGPPLGCASGEGSSIYWTFFTTPSGGTVRSTSGGSFTSISTATAAIVCRLTEDAMEVGGGNYAGGDLTFATRSASSTSGALDRVTIRPTGVVVVMGETGSGLSQRNDIDQITTQAGDLAVAKDLYVNTRFPSDKTKQLKLGYVGPSDEAGIRFASTAGVRVYLTNTAGILTIAGHGTATKTTVEVKAVSGQTAQLISFVGTAGSSVGGITVDGRLEFVSGNEQTTVGAAGAASALPANPTKYLKIKDSAGTTLVVPAYAAA